MLDGLVGTWHLKRLEVLSAEGLISFPYGPDPVGYLGYTSDGFIFVTMRCAERTPAGTQSWFDWTLEQMERAASGYMTYCGRYAVIDDRIEHYIEHSMLPEWVGTTKPALQSSMVTSWFSLRHVTAARQSPTRVASWSGQHELRPEQRLPD
jgi:hypothetical protein